MTSAERIARAVLEPFASAYWACGHNCITHDGAISAQERVIAQAAMTLEPLLREIEREAERRVSQNPS